MGGGEIYDGNHDIRLFDSDVTSHTHHDHQDQDQDDGNNHRSEADCERDVEEGQLFCSNGSHHRGNFVVRGCRENHHPSRNTNRSNANSNANGVGMPGNVFVTADPITYNNYNYDEDEDDDDTFGTTTTTIPSVVNSNSNSNNNNNNSRNQSRSRNRNRNATISFREIEPGDRIRIQELFEEWFPVEYKDDFYNNLCQHRTMGGNELYTIVATTPLCATAAVNSTVNSTATGLPRQQQQPQPQPQHEQIIACLLGCKLSARKLSPSSRALLIASYQSRNNNNNNNNNNNPRRHYHHQYYHQSKRDSSDSEPDDEINTNPKNDGSDGNEEDLDLDLDRNEVFYIMTLGVIEEYRKRGLASYLVERALDDQIVVAGGCHHEGEEEDPETPCTGIQRRDDGNHHNLNHDLNESFRRASPSPTTTTPYATHTRTRTRTRTHTRTNTRTRTRTNTRTICETAYLHVIVDNAAAIRFYEKLGFERLREIVDYYTIDDEKHNCFLYAKCFDRASVERRRLRRQSLLVAVSGKLVFWVESVWSSLKSYYAWVVLLREGGGGVGGGRSSSSSSSNNNIHPGGGGDGSSGGGGVKND